jgi:hypothetical protein
MDMDIQNGQVDLEVKVLYNDSLHSKLTSIQNDIKNDIQTNSFEHPAYILTCHQKDTKILEKRKVFLFFYIFQME